MKKLLPLVLLFCLSGCDSDIPLNPSDELTGVPVMSMRIDHEKYLHLLGGRLSDASVSCDVKFLGEYEKGTVEASGAGSRYHAKWSYKIEFPEDVYLDGLNEFSLSSQIFDRTMLHTNLASHLYRAAGFPVFNSRHVFLNINNRDQGLFQMIERVELNFFARRGLPVYELIKLGFDSKFSFENGTDQQFVFEKKIPEDNNFTWLYGFIHTIDTVTPEGVFRHLGEKLNIDNYIRYHAMTTILNNEDAFRNNFFLWMESPGAPYKLIPWDFDKCFYRTRDVKLYGRNAIIEKLFKNDSALALYKSVTKDFLNNYFTEGALFPVIDSLAANIKEAYNLDPYLGNGRYDFDHEISDLKSYITNRRNYLLENIDSLGAE